MKLVPGIVLGDLLQRIEVVEPNSGHDFVFVFSKDVFVVHRGQRLRVVFDTWHDERAMNAGVKADKLISPPFDCP